MFFVYLGIKKNKGHPTCIYFKNTAMESTYLHGQWYSARNAFRQEMLLFYGVLSFALSSGQQ
jgi:ssDNA-specific exonuclease RecJ